jgi:hypothetical protein
VRRTGTACRERKECSGYRNNDATRPPSNCCLHRSSS